jgi:AmmeMemoRadiSam system protein A
VINLSIINAVMVPHPPLIVPDIGKGKERKISTTIKAYEKAADLIAVAQPDTIIITTPHNVMYADWFHISPGEGARGSFASFGAGNVSFSVDYDREFVASLSAAAKEADFPAGTEGQRDAALDHASMVPLYFLGKAYGGKKLPPVVRISLSGLPLTDHYKLGMLIKDTANKLGRKVSVIASGDLSHCLKSDGPYGYKKEGPQYDARIMDVMERAAFGELFSFGDAFCESAGECGHRSFVIMAGCFDGLEVNAEKLSYEGPFGVGYGVCLFIPGKENSVRHFLEAEISHEAARLSERKSKEDAYVRLARLAVETFVLSGKRAVIPPGLPDEMTKRQAGTFVSLHMQGQLRGCIGTTEATTPNIAGEIIQNGISACSRDPRFSPVRADELPIIEYSVDVLGEPEDINSTAELDVRKYGVIVTSGNRRGLLLPDLEGVDTIEDQIAIAKKKAGIGAGEKISLQRFTVVRHV